MDELKNNIPIEVIQLIQVDWAEHYRIVPFELTQSALLCYSDKLRLVSSSELTIVLGKTVQMVPVASEAIDYLLSKHYRRVNTSSTGEVFKANAEGEFLEGLINEAIQIGSSDIHVEKYEQRARVRMRVDGSLIERFVIEPDKYPELLNKIKIKAKLDIAEKRLPQDGRITFKDMDLRVSIIPSQYGEKAVLRLLNKQSGNKSLTELGLSKSQKKEFLKAISKSQGLVLISGPTGSGKTTTLYASLKQLNKPKVNIVTIEDPVEYTLEGINQVPLREAIGLDFSSALRAFLRQDPDIIMVGEIRDKGTAQMAIRASLTGHLVFSTIHTNSAWGIVSRLLDMGIPQFLIASTLNLVVAQRLVRLLCNHCKQATGITNEQSKVLGNRLKTALIHKPVGCSACFYSGFNGRKAIYEVITIANDLRDKLMLSETQIKEDLTKHNVQFLSEAALELLESGQTCFTEVYQLIVE
tara:strand:+ start:441 stop:1844 length:1404 start_codon:yes stop_codon:yes gene_type:complete